MHTHIKTETIKELIHTIETWADYEGAVNYNISERISISIRSLKFNSRTTNNCIDIFNGPKIIYSIHWWSNKDNHSSLQDDNIKKYRYTGDDNFMVRITREEFIDRVMLGPYDELKELLIWNIL